jgi:hypothetical protein
MTRKDWRDLQKVLGGASLAIALVLWLTKR